MYTVVIVEDEYMIRCSLTKIIENNSEHFKVIGEAEDGREGLTLLEDLWPDLLITDVCMPVMDGLELIQAARERNKAMESIIISGYDEFSYAQKAVQFGVHDYLLKPIRPQNLQKALDRVFEKMDRKKQRWAKQEEWALACREAAQKIVKHMRLFDENALMTELKNLHQTLLEREKELDLYSFRDMYQAFISACNQLIKKQPDLAGIGVVSVNEWTSPTHVYRQVWASIFNIMNDFRNKKNLKVNLKINLAIDYINQHYKEAISLEEVAQAVDLTPPYFSRAFSESLGKSFVQYVTQLRMERAKQLLQNPMLKLYEIADTVGYPEYPHFSRAFKKFTGVSPSDFRKKLID